MQALNMDTAKHRFQASDHEARQSQVEWRRGTPIPDITRAHAPLPERGDVVITFFSLEGARFNSPGDEVNPECDESNAKKCSFPIETNRR